MLKFDIPLVSSSELEQYAYEELSSRRTEELAAVSRCGVCCSVAED